MQITALLTSDSTMVVHQTGCSNDIPPGGSGYPEKLHFTAYARQQGVERGWLRSLAAPARFTVNPDLAALAARTDYQSCASGLPDTLAEQAGGGAALSDGSHVRPASMTDLSESVNETRGKAPRIGPTMRAIADVVSACPGTSKAGALRAAGLPDRGIGYLRPVERACAAGLIIVERPRPNLCRLFASKLDRDIWHLREELLHGVPTAERATEILAAIEVLRAQQAREYVVASRQDRAP